MFIVLFEVQPKKSEWDRYLELAAMLRPELEQIPGFIKNDRYESERTEGRVLSLSLWDSEKALVRWRTHGRHHRVQEQGRFEVFEDYRLRIGEVVADSDGGDLPQTRFDTTEVGRAKTATVTEVKPGGEAPDTPDSPELMGTEWYTGINTEGARILVASWHDDDAAAEFCEHQSLSARSLRVRVVREYGMHERREAPQYYPEVRQRARS
jgi:heme-degrading monooxygenase HmoA